MEISSVSSLIDVIKKAGQYALQKQVNGEITPGLKRDGSYITNIDKSVEEIIIGNIEKLFPDANILSEESERMIKNEDNCTFVLDPIDGTTAYSYGMPEWCVSLGLLDHQLDPVAGIIFAPALNILIVSDIEKTVQINQKDISIENKNNAISRNTIIMVPSSVHKQIDLSNYPGRILSLGSAAINLCYPLLYADIYVSIETRGNHIWDIAAAHAIYKSSGRTILDVDGNEINYQALVSGDSIGKVIIGGNMENIQTIRNYITGLQ